MREDARTKAHRLLTDGRVTVTRVDARNIGARVRGDTAAVHEVAYTAGRWSCTCEARTPRCSHVQAVQLCTVIRRPEGVRPVIVRPIRPIRHRGDPLDRARDELEAATEHLDRVRARLEAGELDGQALTQAELAVHHAGRRFTDLIRGDHDQPPGKGTR